MTMKSVLLGAAAGIVAIGAAQAADLPMTKGEAVEYVKVCSTFGPGFFYIPGSDTCLKIGGEVRAYYRVFGGTGFSRADDRSAFNAEGHVWFDARTQTDWGLLRSYFQIDAQSHPINNQGRGNAATSNTFSIDKAFIQFGGLTAGYAHSFFGFYDNEYGDTIFAPYYAEGATVNMLAYTAQFGGGFQATLALEDGRDHRNDNNGTSYITGLPTGVTYSGYQGGQEFPDVVAQLRYDADWGSLAAQGALHESRSADNFTVTAPGGGSSVSTALDHENKLGYAVGATLLIKIPVLEGGHFVVEGQYANGATQYLGLSDALGTYSVPGDIYPTLARTVGTKTFLSNWETAKGWSITGEFGFNLTSQLTWNLVGAYGSVKSEDFNGTALAPPKFTAYTLATNLQYQLVKGFWIEPEVAYTHQKMDGLLDTKTGLVSSDSENIWQGGLRIRRTF